MDKTTEHLFYVLNAMMVPITQAIRMIWKSAFVYIMKEKVQNIHVPRLPVHCIYHESFETKREAMQANISSNN